MFFLYFHPLNVKHFKGKRKKGLKREDFGGGVFISSTDRLFWQKVLF